MYQIFLQMEDPWFKKKKWDLATFEQNLTKISLADQQGVDDSDPFMAAEKMVNQGDK